MRVAQGSPARVEARGQVEALVRRGKDRGEAALGRAEGERVVKSMRVSRKRAGGEHARSE